MQKQKKEQKSVEWSHLRKVVLFLLLGTLTALAPITTDIYLPSFPSITADLNTSASLTQLSLTSGLIGLALGQLVFGPLSDIRGRKMPLIIALIIYVGASALCALSPKIWILIILRFIQGAAGAGGVVIARACVRDLYSGSEMTKMYSILMLVVGLAPILAPVIGGQLLYLMPWNGIFLFLSIAGFLLLVAVIFGLPETLSNQQRLKGGIQNTFRTFKGLLSNRLYIGYASTQGFIFASMFAYISGSSFVYQGIFAVSPQEYSFLFGINAIGLMIATQITGRLAGKISETTLLMFGLGYSIFGGVSLLIAIVTDVGLTAFVIALFICISSVGIISTTCFPLAMQSQGGNAGSASALLGLLQFTIGGLIAPLVGLGGSETALPMGLAIVLCEVGAVVVYIFVVRCAKKQDMQTERKEMGI